MSFTERCRNQLRIQVLGKLFQLASGETKDKAIAVVVRLACDGGVVAAGFNHREVILGNHPIGSRPDAAGDPGT